MGKAHSGNCFQTIFSLRWMCCDTRMFNSFSLRLGVQPDVMKLHLILDFCVMFTHQPFLSFFSQSWCYLMAPGHEAASVLRIPKSS